jgi:hypothetical protein
LVGHRGAGGVVAVVLLATAVTGLIGDAPTSAQETGGALRIAYPEEPVVWHPALRDDPPTIDLAALWGVPLYRYDHHGQLRPALVDEAEVEVTEASWAVTLRLREGRWSDGEPITGGDVAATIAVLADGPLAREFAAVEGVEAIDERTVRIGFSEPVPRWPHLLAGARSILPAHVLEDGGLERYADGVPVSAGPFALTDQEPGLRAVFERHDDGPLGAPGLDRIEVYFTPSYETALGLLAERRVDLVMGHVAPNPEGRARRLDDIEAAAPVGGTWASLTFPEGGVLGGSPDARAAARDLVSVAAIADGLLGRDGEPMTSPVPGLAGPWRVDRALSTELSNLDLNVFIRSRQEIAGVTGRMLQADLQAGGAQAEIIRLDLDEDVDRRVDVEFALRRDGPRPSLVSRLPDAADSELVASVGQGDDLARLDLPEGERALAALHDAAWERPLYRVGVAHAWRPELDGIRPSGWPGLALWEAERLRWDDETGPPAQQPTVTDDG